MSKAKCGHLARIFAIGVCLAVTAVVVIKLSSSSSSSPLSTPRSFLRPIADVDADLNEPPNPHEGWLGPITRRLSKRLVAERASSRTTSIPISSSLPDTAGLSPPLLKLWDTAFDSLSSSAHRRSSSALARAGLKGTIVGIPGTRLETAAAARELQAHLDCMSGNGEWVYEPQGGERERSGAAGLTVHKHSGLFASCDKRFYKGARGKDKAGKADWDVRESLKWRWVPSPSCTRKGADPPTPLSRRAFCGLLAHKAILMVGDTLQYSLHDLILDWTSVEPHSCYGDLYCKEHSLCGALRRAKSGVEDWEADERVFLELPTPPAMGLEPRSESHSDEEPADVERRAEKGRSTMLRYRRSDGLQLGSQHTTPAYIHPITGIREVNQQWLADATRADVTILTKPPLPLPLRGHNETWDSWWDEQVDHPDERIVEAAWRITEDVWLPEVVGALRSVRSSAKPGLLVVYRGGWRAHHDCGFSHDETSTTESFEGPWASPGDGPPPHARQPSLRQLMFRTPSSPSSSGDLTSLHTLFYNLQTIFQNHIMRTIIAPAFGVAFLDLESTLSVWRSGMLGGSAGAPFEGGVVDQSQPGAGGRGGLGVGLRSAASGDCSRYCIPSPGMALEEAFLGGLMRVLENVGG